MSFHNNRLLVAPQAQQDIIDILRYTGETWGQEQILSYGNKIDEAFNTIGRNPEIGRRSSELPETHRLYAVGSHFVVYRRIQGEVIAVVRMLHQRMNLTRHI